MPRAGIAALAACVVAAALTARPSTARALQCEWFELYGPGETRLGRTVKRSERVVVGTALSVGPTNEYGQWRALVLVEEVLKGPPIDELRVLASPRAEVGDRWVLFLEHGREPHQAGPCTLSPSPWLIDEISELVRSQRADRAPRVRRKGSSCAGCAAPAGPSASPLAALFAGALLLRRRRGGARER